MINPETIIARTAAAWGVQPTDILSRRRSKHISAARRAVALELLNAGLSLSDVGRLLGRDHSTVFYYRKLTETPAAPAEQPAVDRRDPVVDSWLRECGL